MIIIREFFWMTEKGFRILTREHILMGSSYLFDMTDLIAHCIHVGVSGYYFF